MGIEYPYGVNCSPNLLREPCDGVRAVHVAPQLLPAAAVEEMDDGNVVVVADGPWLGNFPGVSTGRCS